MEKTSVDFAQTSADKNFKYVRGIDGLRALSVIAVMLFHIDPALLPGGFSGVDVFFVISGYVVSASLARQTNANFLHFALCFYSRRILRIIPALIVCLVVISITSTLFVPASWLSNTNKYTGLAAFFGLSNFALIWFNDGYFSPRVEFNPYVHTWSLGVEEQFYLIYPFIFFAWIKCKGKTGALGAIAIWLLPILFTSSLLHSWHETPLNPDNAFYLLPSRFWELALGALLYELHSGQRPTSYLKVATKCRNKLLYFALGLILLGLGFIFSDNGVFPFPWALLPTAGAALLITALTSKSQERPFVQRILESPALGYVGKISYSLYLWHWPVYVLLRWTIGLETAFEIGLAITLAFALASISYHLIETPIRKNQFVISLRNWQVVSIGMATVTISFLFSGFIFKSQPHLSLSVTRDNQTWYPYEWPAQGSRAEHKDFVGHKLFVMGDSHTGAYSTMLQNFSDDYGVEVIKFSKGGCGVANLLKPVISKSTCAKIIESQLSRIEASASPGDILFLASLRVNRLGDQWASFSEEKVIKAQLSEEYSAYRKLALLEAIQLIKRMENAGLRIVIDAPKPIFKSPPFRCSDWFNSSNPTCIYGFNINRNFLLLHRKPVMKSLEVLAGVFPNLVIWDPFPVLCKTEVCSAFDKNKPMFFDGDHLSAHGNRILYPSFRDLIKKIWLSEQTTKINKDTHVSAETVSKLASQVQQVNN